MEYEFKGRKPSAKQVKAKLAEMIKSNPPVAVVSWGENFIEAIRIGKETGSYIGNGWIKDISGSDIVRALPGNSNSVPAWKL